MRVDNEPGFVIHTQPYRETSQLIDLFTLNHGRLRCVAKGVRKAGKKGQSHRLLPFCEMRFSWSGRHELKTLAGSDLGGEPRFFQDETLFTGLYINELLYRLMHEHDPHPGFYQRYQAAMQLLASSALQQMHLRMLELALLDELGYGLELDCDAENGAPLQLDQQYTYYPGRGVLLAQDTRQARFSGRHLLAINARQLDEPEVLLSAKQLLRGVLDYYLDGKPLNSRQLYSRFLKQRGE